MARRSIEDDLQEIVGTIYDAALDPTLWPSVTARIARLVDCATSIFQVRTRQLEHLGLVGVVGFGADDLAEYVSHWAAQDLWALRGTPDRMPPGRACFLNEIVPDAELAASEGYNDFLKPRDDLFHGLGGYFDIDAGTVGQIGLQRPRSLGPCDEPQRRALEVLFPHLRRALQMQARLARSEGQRAAASATLDRIDVGIVLVDAALRAQAVNRMAEAILRANDGLRLRNGRLSVSVPAEDRALEALVRRTILTAQGQAMYPGGALAVSRPSLRRPLSLLVVPLPRGERASFNGFDFSQSVTAIFITDPELRSLSIPQALHRAYGLTAREAQIAEALLAGDNLETVAERLRITRESARTYLKRVLSKTDTGRQAELVSLILRSMAPLA